MRIKPENVYEKHQQSNQLRFKIRALPLSYNLLDGEATLPAIVFLHGLFGSKTNFNSIAKAMVQRTGRRVLTVDARNHGDSPHSQDASYEAMSQDLQGLLPQLGLVPCVLVGHSMGGKTAMLLALQRPDVVERLVAVDISPVGTTPGSYLGSYIAAMKAVDIPERVRHSQARKLVDVQLSTTVKDPAIRQFLLSNLVEVDGRFTWRVNLDTLAQYLDKILTFPPQLESYSGPTLFLRGGNSRYIEQVLDTLSTDSRKMYGENYAHIPKSWGLSKMPKGKKAKGFQEGGTAPAVLKKQEAKKV
ncbi:hypothetical protein STEG23_023857, partial [Scotinomys teguina]